MNKLKVAKVTLDGYYNYGNRLQCYALQEYLEGMQISVDTIWHDHGEVDIIKKGGWEFKDYIKFIINWKSFRTNSCNGFRESDVIRRYKFREFTQKFIHTCYGYLGGKRGNKELLNNQYDYLIVGSDQVWNPYFLKAEDWMFLTFVPREKRIAYAASFGISELPKSWEAKYRKWISEMAAVSVREQQGCKIIESLTNRSVPVLVDPTMLLTKDEWNKIAKQPIWYEGHKYILLYFLGKIPGKVRVRIQKYAAERHLEIIDLMDYKKLDWYTVDPSEFLYLIEHAEFIYTDSFHGTVFSILYEKSFIVFGRTTKVGKPSMNSRIETLLSLFHLEDRFMEYSSVNNQKDFEEIEEIKYGGDTIKILEKEKKKTFKYFQKAMHLEN